MLAFGFGLAIGFLLGLATAAAIVLWLLWSVTEEPKVPGPRWMDEVDRIVQRSKL